MMHNININRYLDDIKDRTFIYTILTYRAEMFYNRLKMGFKMPVILTSACMSIINSNIEDMATLKLVNIIFNILSAVILAVSSSLQLEAKEQEFLNTKKKFLKLNSEIECKVLAGEPIDMMYINSLVERYNAIEESLDYPIPNFILHSTRERYKETKTLPLIINGVDKKEIYRPANSIMGSPLAVIPENRELEVGSRTEGC